MARLGVLGDIHGNREALAAVLAALDARRVERFACLGDIVGYNADPDECAALVRERRMLAVAGDHDLIAVRRLGFGSCANDAAYALRRTRRSIAAETAAYLEALPMVREIAPGMVIAQDAAWLRDNFPGARICFFGHGHAQKVYAADGEEIRGDRIILDPQQRYFISPGAVDASRRSRHKLAECAVLDDDRIEFLRVPYDVAASECKAAAFGYRIPLWLDRAYSLRKRLSRLPQRLAAMRPAAARWPSPSRSRETN